MSARDTMLNRISGALGRTENQAPLSVHDQPAEVRDWLAGSRRHTLPRVNDNDLIGTLTAAMESVLMSVVRLQSVDDCPSAVDFYLESQGIDVSANGAVTVAPALSDIAWPEHYRAGAATGTETVSITPCVAAIAETGSVVTSSGGQTPATLNFLPDTHIVLVYESQVMRHVDDVFEQLRVFDAVPRSVNIITGPSRTADIEQTLEIGAHGPRRMHILLLPGKP